MCTMADGGGEYPPFIEPIDGRGARVLVVEDDKPLADVMRTILERSGYAVTSCADGLAAIRELEQGDFACIVLDLHMTTFDGEQLLDLMAFDHAAMIRNVIVISGYHTRAESVRGKVGDVLIKPVDQSTLQRAVAARMRAGCASSQPDEPKQRPH